MLYVRKMIASHTMISIIYLLINQIKYQSIGKEVLNVLKHREKRKILSINQSDTIYLAKISYLK